MNINNYLPVNINIFDPNYKFDNIFLNIDFDSFITQNSLLNSTKLYLIQKNKYINNTLKRTNNFINLQQNLSTYTHNNTHYTLQHNKQKIKQDMKHLFKLQKEDLKTFLHYISYITKYATIHN